MSRPTRQFPTLAEIFNEDEDLEEQIALAAGNVVGFTAPLGAHRQKKKKIKEQNAIASLYSMSGLMSVDAADSGVESADSSSDSEEENLETEDETDTNAPSQKKKKKNLNHSQMMMWSGDVPLPVIIPVKYSLLECYAPKKVVKVICDKQIKPQSVRTISDFLKFCQKYLGIHDFPIINLHTVKHENMTTGAYDMATNNINCLVGKRLIVDVLRTLAHELVHRKQHERGDLETQLSEIDPMDEMGDIDTDFENEAYTLAGNLVKIYCRKQKVLPKDELYALNENKKTQSFSDKIKALKIYGFGGQCGAAAIDINEKIFDGQGTLVAAVNEFWFERGRILGHVAVKYDGKYYDATGEIGEEELLAWGMVDPEDSDVNQESDSEFTEEDAFISNLYELSRQEVEKFFDLCIKENKKPSTSVKYWHVTKQENLPSIKKNGLIAKKPLDYQDEPGVYLFKSKIDAEEALMNWLGDRFEEDDELILLPVDKDAVRETVSGADYEIISRQNIAPSAIGTPIKLEESKIQERSKKFSKPIEVYHGTSDKFYNAIMSSGLDPNPRFGSWRGKYEDGSEINPSLASLEGTYLAGKVSTASSYAYDAARKTKGAPVIFQIDVVPQSTYADEDSIDIEYLVHRAVGQATGKLLNPWQARAMKDFAPAEYKDIQEKFAQLFHERYAASTKHEMNKDLLYKAFDVAIERRLPYMAKNNEWNARAGYWGTVEMYVDRGKLDDMIEKTGRELPEHLSPVEAEKAYKEIQEKITRAYRGSTKPGTDYLTMRVPTKIGTTGRNKITAAVMLPTNDNNKVITVLYGIPSQKLLSGLEANSGVAYPVVDLQGKPISENVLDKMGHKVATKKIRRGSVSGPMYIDKNDPTPEKSKKIIKKVAKNLNRKPYSHHPPMMGIK